MAGNSIGKIFKLTTFGESHGPAIGGIIEGCPAGMPFDKDFIQLMLSRRRPGLSEVSSPRKEDDEVEILSGIFNNKTLGTPIGFIIRNKDARPDDYQYLKDSYRPSHADYTWEAKFGIRDHRGGGRSSARETATRVVGGTVALQMLSLHNIEIHAWVSSIGKIQIPEAVNIDYGNIYSYEYRCPHPATAEAMHTAIHDAKANGDTLGGIISCVIKGVKPGLGEPVFDKLHAVLGKAMLSINAVKGFEIGSGFASSAMKGSEHNDPFVMKNDKVTTTTNHSGGIQGGISNGNDIFFRTAFKPVATIMKEQQSVTSHGKNISLTNQGRHDSCVVPRAVPIVETMAALVMADFLLLSQLSKF